MRVTTALLLCAFVSGCSVFGGGVDQTDFNPDTYSPYTYKTGPAVSAAGAAYIAAPCVALVWLREDRDNGLALLLTLFACVWATDTAAFFAGKYIRGPRFSPDISPSKTWAGLVGGVAAGGIAGIGTGVFLFKSEAYGFFLILGVSLALATEFGDMVESAIKRRFGVKDASGLIPGHGGALDRLDGMIFATAAMAIVVAVVSTWKGA